MALLLLAPPSVLIQILRSWNSRSFPLVFHSGETGRLQHERPCSQKKFLGTLEALRWEKWQNTNARKEDGYRRFG